jgi:tetratricopeptide (TPR) repeat protein
MNEVADRVARLLGSGERRTAEELIASVADHAVDHGIASAVLALYLKTPATAVEHAQRAVAAGGGAPAEHMLATAHLAAGDGESALAHARKGVAADASPRSRATLGGILIAVQRYSDAAAVLRQVASEEPRSFEVQLNLGIAAAKAGDYGEAIGAFGQALDINPSDQRTVQYLMNMFADVGRWMGALAALDLSRRDDQPGHVSVLFDLATVHIYRLIAAKFPGPGIGRDPDEAVKRLMVDSMQRSPAVQLVAARTLADVGRLDEARQLADRLDKIIVDPTERAGVLYLRGTLVDKRDRPAALALYEQALAADPTRGDAAANAISCLLEDGSPQAFAKIQTVLATVDRGQRGRAELVFNEAIYLARTNRVPEARAKLAVLVGALPQDHQLYQLAVGALAQLPKTPS